MTVQEETTVEATEVTTTEVDTEEIEEGNENGLNAEELQKQLTEEKAARLAAEAKAEQYKNKLGDWYKKHQKIKETIANEYVSKDDVLAIVEAREAETIEISELSSKFDDFKDLLPEVQKLQREEGLTPTKAYYQLQWMLLADPAYRNKVMGDRTAPSWTLSKTETKSKAAEILWVAPKIAQPRNK